MTADELLRLPDDGMRHELEHGGRGRLAGRHLQRGARQALAWLEAGTRLVLVVDPEKRTITAYRAADDVRVVSRDAELDAGDVVPGWRLPVGELFA